MNEAKTQNCGWCGATQTHENTKCFNCDHKLDQTKAAPAAAAIAGSSSATLLAAIVNEIEVLEKEIELMQLRLNECTDRATEQTLRNFGSCLWRHKCALEKSIAANAAMSDHADNKRGA